MFQLDGRFHQHGCRRRDVRRVGNAVRMRMVREKGAWTFRFDDHADTVDDLPIGGYEPGTRPGI